MSKSILSSCFELNAFRLKAFNFLERPKTVLATCYHCFLLLLILISVNVSVLSTTKISEKLNYQSHKFELVLSMFFAGEFLIRFLLCGIVIKYRGLTGKLRFLTSIYAIIDLIIIISALWELSNLKNSGESAIFNIFRFARFFQICRVFRLDRKNGNLIIMWHTVRVHKKELLTCYFICFNILFIGAYVIYMVEKPGKNDAELKINNMADSLYWGIITFTSVGFGDFTPQTWTGKALTGLFSILGCAFFSLPAGIIGSGFALQVSKEKKERRYIKIRNPAAIVIQTAWRNYAVNENLVLQATWYYFFPRLPHAHRNTNTKFFQTRWNRSRRNSYIDSNEHIDSSSNESIHISKERGLSFIKRHHETDDMRKKSVFPFLKVKRDIEKTNSNSLSVGLPSDTNIANGSFVSAASLYGIFDLLEGVPEIHASNIPIGNLILKKYKFLTRFILALKLESTITSFKNIRQPYVNVELMMQRSNINALEALHTLKIAVSQLGKMNEDLKVVKNELRDIKHYLKSKD